MQTDHCYYNHEGGEEREYDVRIERHNNKSGFNLNLKHDGDIPSVSNVSPNGKELNLQDGDYITALNGMRWRPHTAEQAAAEYTAAKKNGDITLTIRRKRGACLPLPSTSQECSQHDGLVWYRNQCYSLGNQLLLSARAEQDRVDAQQHQTACQEQDPTACTQNPLCTYSWWQQTCTPKQCEDIPLKDCPAYCGKGSGLILTSKSCMRKTTARARSQTSPEDCEQADGIWHAHAYDSKRGKCT